MTVPEPVMPLHRYQSPNGKGLCNYRSEGFNCGQKATAPVHFRLLSASWDPAEDITGHPFLTKPGIPPETGCQWEVEPGLICGQYPDVHPNLTVRVKADGQMIAVGPPVDPVGYYLSEKADQTYETFHGATLPLDDPPTTVQMLVVFQDQALRLVVGKNAMYGDAWRKQGYIGNLARILSKVERLRNMVWTDDRPNNDQLIREHEETLRDTLLDLANLCAFAAANLADGNRWGGDRG